MTTPFLQNAMLATDATKRMTQTVIQNRVAAIDKEIANAMGSVNKLVTDQQESMGGDGLQDSMNIASKATGRENINVASISATSNVEADSTAGGDESFKQKFIAQMSECFPCEWRMWTEEAGKFDWKGKFEDKWDEYLKAYQEFYGKILDEFTEMMDMFKDLWKNTDVCAFVKWLKDFVCIPDLYKILAALSVLLMDLGGVLDGFGLDMVLGFVFPLFMPTLQGMASVLQEFMNLILDPLNCIIDSAQTIIKKLDISSFQLPQDQNLTLPFVNIAERKQKKTERTQQIIKLGVEGGIHYPTSAKGETDYLSFDKASVEFKGIDHADDYAYSKEMNLPDLGATNTMRHVAGATKMITDTSERYQTLLNSVFADLINALKMTIARIEKFLGQILDELKKLIEEYVLGYTEKTSRAQKQKLAVIQMIGVVKGIIGLFKTECWSDPKEGAVELEAMKQLAKENSYQIHQDAAGNIHIDEPDEFIAPVRAILGDSTISPSTSFITQTGNPVLDAKVAGIVEKMTTPVKVVVGCPKNLSSTDVDRYNDWLSGSRKV
jgi:hypothetical protein